MDLNDRPIPVPWSNRIRFLLTGRLQGLLFALSVAAVVVLSLGNRPRVILPGQVEMIQVTVPATRDGLLQDTPSPLAKLDRVERGITPIARLDVSESLLQMQALTAERNQLLAELESERDRIRQSNIQWQWQIDQERRRQEQQQTDRDRNRQSAREHLDQLTNQANDLQQQKREVEIDQQKIAATVRKTEIEIESAMNERTRQLGLIERRMSPVAERLRIEQQIKLLEQSLLSARELETLRTLQSSELDLQLAAVGKRLSEAMQGLASMNTDSSTMQATLQSGFNEPPNSHALLEPFVQAIAVQDAKIRILANQIATNEIMAPASGTVTEIHHLPGTFVKSGDPILTIASDQRRWIVAYIDQRDYWDIQPKTPVQIRILGAQTFVTTSAVAERGNHFEDVPVQLRRDARIAQWGVPIKVPVPHGVNVAPGQMVELVIQ